jgi:hypothetical protein
MESRSTIVPDSHLDIPMPAGIQTPKAANANQTVMTIELDTTKFDAAMVKVRASIRVLKAELADLGRILNPPT